MDYRKLLRDYEFALISQGVGLLLGTLTALVVPKILSTNNYAYWQLFLFYASYVNFFQLGINDGIYLINGGKTRQSIDGRSINSQMRFALVYQFFFAFVAVAFAIFGPFDTHRAFVLICAAICLILVNVATGLGMLFQALNETRRFSISNIVSQGVQLLCVIVLLVARVTDFRIYIGVYLFSRLCSLLYCLYYARDILASGLLSLRDAAQLSYASICVGIKLLIAGMAGSLIVGIARFAVDWAWGIETFGQLSLATSLTSFVLSFISQVSMVLFPALRQASERETTSLLLTLEKVSELIFPIVFTLYFPAAYLVGLWLPRYMTAVAWMALLMPICVFDGKLNLCYATFYKVWRKEGQFLVLNLAAVALSSFGVCAAIFVYASADLAILASVVAVICRSLWGAWDMQRNLAPEKPRLYFGDVLQAIIFVLAAKFLSYAAAFAVCLIAFVGILIVRRHDLMLVVKRLRDAAHTTP